MDFVPMACGAGYETALAIDMLEELKRRLPGFLTAEGSIFVEPHTTLADQTPPALTAIGTPGMIA